MALVFLHQPPVRHSPRREGQADRSIGGITLLLLLLTIPPIPLMLPFSGIKPTDTPLARLLRLDWGGVVLTLGFVTCLGMGLQWGGVSKEWNDAGVIAVSPILFLTVHSGMEKGRHAETADVDTRRSVFLGAGGVELDDGR